MSSSTWYGAFLERNFGWILAELRHRRPIYHAGRPCHRPIAGQPPIPEPFVWDRLGVDCRGVGGRGIGVVCVARLVLVPSSLDYALRKEGRARETSDRESVD
jgi:hypothetical protein